MASYGGLPATDTPRCSGKPGKLRGKSVGMVMVGTTMRSFVYYAPASLDANKPVPLVIAPHGLVAAAAPRR